MIELLFTNIENCLITFDILQSQKPRRLFSKSPIAHLPIDVWLQSKQIWKGLGGPKWTGFTRPRGGRFGAEAGESPSEQISTSPCVITPGHHVNRMAE